MLHSLARFAGRLTHYVLNKLTGGGSSLPGKVALSISPDILKHLSKAYDVYIITGTNGKTLTTSLIYNIAKQIDKDAISNTSGANMLQGITSTFLLSDKPKAGSRPIAILEVDEGSLKNVLTHIKPKAFLHTNIFEDQTDRYGSVEETYKLLVDACRMHKDAVVVANGDLPLFNTVSLENPTYYFGVDDDFKQDTYSVKSPNSEANLQYKTRTYADLGNYYCPDSDFRRPNLTWSCTNIKEEDGRTTFTVNNNSYSINYKGLYNVYNALSAVSMGTLLGASPELIQKAFDEVEPIAGRQEKLKLNNNNINLNIAKNPVGFNQQIELLPTGNNSYNLVIVLNKKDADGLDTSWLERVNFQKLKELNIDKLIYAGEACKELEAALEKHQLLDNNSIRLEDLDDLKEVLTNSELDTYVIANYTAMTDVKKELV